MQPHTTFIVTLLSLATAISAYGRGSYNGYNEIEARDIDTLDEQFLYARAAWDGDDEFELTLRDLLEERELELEERDADAGQWSDFEQTVLAQEEDKMRQSYDPGRGTGGRKGKGLFFGRGGRKARGG